MKKSIFVYLITFLLVTSLQAQGMYFKSGQTGIGIAGNYEIEDVEGGETTTLVLSGSYVMNGNIEFGGGYVKSNYADDLDDDFDLSMFGIEFGGFYHIKDESLPMNFKIGGSYGTLNVESELLDDFGIEMTGKGTSIGGGAYKKIMKTDQFTITGFVNYFNITTEMTVESDYGDSESEDDESSFTSFGVGFHFPSNFFIQPQIERSEDDSGYSIVFGLILPNN